MGTARGGYLGSRYDALIWNGGRPILAGQAGIPGHSFICSRAGLILNQAGAETAGDDMKSPVKDMEAIRALIDESRALSDNENWKAAAAVLEKVVEVDPNQPKSHDLLADAWEKLGEVQKAQSARSHAKAIREERWKREVEAEARGQHEMLGKPSRHEIP